MQYGAYHGWLTRNIEDTNVVDVSTSSSHAIYLTSTFLLSGPFSCFLLSLSPSSHCSSFHLSHSGEGEVKCGVTQSRDVHLRPSFKGLLEGLPIKRVFSGYGFSLATV